MAPVVENIWGPLPTISGPTARERLPVFPCGCSSVTDVRGETTSGHAPRGSRSTSSLVPIIYYEGTLTPQPLFTSGVLLPSAQLQLPTSQVCRWPSFAPCGSQEFSRVSDSQRSLLPLPLTGGRNPWPLRASAPAL